MNCPNCNTPATDGALFCRVCGTKLEAPEVNVCPLCGNVIRAMGESLISCCGVTLPPLEADEPDEQHNIFIEKVEDEHFITVNHEMTKEHYISFIAYLTTDKVQFQKLYPEGNAETRLSLRGKGDLYVYCNKHGLIKKKI